MTILRCEVVRSVLSLRRRASSCKILVHEVTIKTWDGKKSILKFP